MEAFDEQNEEWATVSYGHDGFSEQFVMFLIAEAGIVYPGWAEEENEQQT